MTQELCQKLVSLADKYEVSSFCEEDPSQFLRWYNDEKKFSQADVEVASFIAAMLSFGNRKQFIPKIRQILQLADNSASSVSKWLKSKNYKKDFPRGQQKFYRFYSYDDLQIFFEELEGLLNKADTLGEYFCSEFKDAQKSEEHLASEAGFLESLITKEFSKSKIVPKGKNSANKRIHMFLRWMVRQNSPVDLGLWSWYDAANLLIPLDVHVMKEAEKLGLIPENSTASKTTAKKLTQALKEAFPTDPSRADYALFGLGVDTVTRANTI